MVREVFYAECMAGPVAAGVFGGEGGGGGGLTRFLTARAGEGRSYLAVAFLTLPWCVLFPTPVGESSTLGGGSPEPRSSDGLPGQP